MRFLVLGLGWMTGLVIAGCSDDGVGNPQSTDSAATATPTGEAGDDAADDGATAGDGQGTGSGPAGDSSGGLDDGPGTGTATAGDDTTGGAPTEPECRVDRDCMVVNDCCSCAAVPTTETPPECPKACLQPTCDAMGLFEPQAECRVGLCVFTPKSCNAAEVSCDAPTPVCPDGTLPEVEGSCWSGECVPVQYCDVVPSCEVCERGEACVMIDTQLGPLYACEPVAPGCDGAPSCDCMSEVCPETYDTCVDVEDGISCTCPEC